MDPDGRFNLKCTVSKNLASKFLWENQDFRKGRSTVKADRKCGRGTSELRTPENTVYSIQVLRTDYLESLRERPGAVC